MDSELIKIYARSHADMPDNADRFAAFCRSAWFGAKNADHINMPLSDAFIMTAGLAGEVGEVMELLKKEVRDGTPCRDQLAKEAGDVLYYLCIILDRHNLSPSDAMVACREKILGRIGRDTLRGSGNER